MLTYPGTIDLPEATLDFLTALLADDRERHGNWRKLAARDQALLALAHLRNGDTYARLAEGFQVGVHPVGGVEGRPRATGPARGRGRRP